MRIVPAHCGLDHAVQVFERHPGRHFDPAPDGRLGVGQYDLQTNDVAHATRLAGSGFQFLGRSTVTRLTG